MQVAVELCMPSVEHETLMEVFRDRPALLAVLAKLLALEAGAQPQVVESKLTDLDPAEHSADLVLHYPGSRPRAVVLEVPRSQDADKRFTWPYYQAGVRLRLRCGVALMVVATTSRWRDGAAQAKRQSPTEAYRARAGARLAAGRGAGSPPAAAAALLLLPAAGIGGILESCRSLT